MLQSAIRNHLLSGLSADAWNAIRTRLEPIDLPRNFHIAGFDAAIAHHYFPEDGVASMVAVSAAGERTEIGLVGRDGVTPLVAILDAERHPFEFMMQVSGKGHRIKREALQELVAENVEVRRILERFALSLFTQTAYTALSNAVQRIDARLARWILMIDDRVDGHRIDVTHEFLAVMLAVRRPGVTNALHVLEGENLIYSDRGVIRIRDRGALEAFAGAAYGTPERVLRRMTIEGGS